jgi:hypothetical protein
MKHYMWKTEGKRLSGEPSCKYDSDMKVGPEEICYESVASNCLTEGQVQGVA